MQVALKAWADRLCSRNVAFTFTNRPFPNLPPRSTRSISNRKSWEPQAGLARGLRSGYLSSAKYCSLSDRYCSLRQSSPCSSSIVWGRCFLRKWSKIWFSTRCWRLTSLGCGRCYGWCSVCWIIHQQAIFLFDPRCCLLVCHYPRHASQCSLLIA